MFFFSNILRSLTNWFFLFYLYNKFKQMIKNLEKKKIITFFF